MSFPPTRRAGFFLLVVVMVSAGLLLALGPGRVVDRLDQLREEAARRAEARSVSSYPTTSTTTSVPEPGVGPLGAARQLLASPTEENAVMAIRAMRDTGDERWVPFLVDMLRLFGSEVAVVEAGAALQSLTGDPGPDDDRQLYTHYGSVMYDREIDPGPEYVAWKADLYGFIDAEFVDLVAQVTDPVIAAQLQWGGVARGGIPELNEPPTLPGAEADYMQHDELTFGAAINGVTRAYPHRILDHHELANDVLGGEPVALANCTLCRTGILFSRRVGGEVLDFQTSGLLRNSNKVMVDRQTESLWNQLTGEAFAGPLAGTVLDRFPLVVERWGDWVAGHPETEVVAIPVGYAYSYQPGDAYAGYYGSDELWFPVIASPDVFPPKAEVATLDIDGLRLAVGIDALAAAGPQVFAMGERRIAVIPTEGGARFYDAGSSGPTSATELVEILATAVRRDDAMVVGEASWPRVQSGQSFWFAWYANYPDTEWWAG